MIRRVPMVLLGAWALGQFAIAQVGASDPPGLQEPVADRHENGDARWAHSLIRERSEVCADTAPWASLLVGRGSNGTLRENAADCVSNYILIRNESARPIQCRVELLQPSPDDGNRTRLEDEFVIGVGGRAASMGSYGPESLVPHQHSSTCVAVPASLEPLEDPPAECVGEVRYMKPIDAFYPPASKRRGETGVVVLEFVVSADDERPAEVRVVASSGFDTLDTGALRFMREVRITRACPDQRYRIKVGFRLDD